LDGLILIEQDPAELFTVGSRLQLTLSLPNEDLACAASLAGWKVGGYLIAELPAQEDVPDILPRTACEVRHLIAGRLVGYHTEVRGTYAAPERLLVLAFPRRIDPILARKHPRVSLRQAVRLAPAQPAAGSRPHHIDPPARGIIEDLSPTGCRVELAHDSDHLQPGVTVKLAFELPGLGQVSNLSGKVKYRRTEPMRSLAGIEFRFQQMEFIEFKGWGGTVKRAIEQFVIMRQISRVTAGGVWERPE
jgi:hypothetical protein